MDGERVRQRFKDLLAERRAAPVPLAVREAEKAARVAFLQRETSMARAQLDSTFDLTERSASAGLHEEHLILTTEAGPQGQVPLLVLRPAAMPEEIDGAPPFRRPAVIFLHSTGRSKEMMLPHMQAYARRGYVSVSVDSRYHGERAASDTAYRDALISAWKTGREMPFLFDTVWDLTKLLDYLTARPDIDQSRIGITGVSLGGMQAWLAAAADPRIAVAVPLIGVQCFRWAVENDSWHARVASIPHVFEVARKDLGKDQVDAETVAQVWQRIAPGLMDELDSRHTLAAIAPRPLLVLNGAEDPRCPVKGLEHCVARAAQTYSEAGAPDHFKFVAFEGVGHATIEEMEEMTMDWMDRFLQPSL